jgi:nicotinate-nucleotide adenylyltransferase
VLDVEVRDPTPVRTPITMRELSEKYPTSQLVLYRGLDSLHRAHRDCFTLPNVVVLALDRTGFDQTFQQVLARYPKFEHVMDRIVYVGSVFAADLSSTQVRDEVREGRPITGMVPETVEAIIRGRGLYADS